MPAKSKAQQIKLRMKFGEDWLHEHHFDNPSKNLPYHVKGTAGMKKRKRKYG